MSQVDKFPRWSAPLIGPVVGASLGWIVTLRRGQPEVLSAVGTGAIIGLIAGSLIWFVDHQTNGSSASRDSFDRFAAESAPPTDRYGMLFGLILAFLSIGLFMMPLIGLVTSVVAFLVNYRYGGLALFLSFVGLGLSLLVTGLIIVIAVFPR